MDGDELYGLPLERFVPERAALAKALRSDGDRAGAAEVAALRKPSISAWAVNQLVRTQPRAIKELYASGDGLVSAQERLLSGDGDSRSLREANARERSAVDALLALARGLLSSDGVELSPAILDRVSDTLHAAALDDAARDAIRDGRLERELQHAGLGAVGAPPGGRAGRAPRETETQPTEPEPTETEPTDTEPTETQPTETQPTPPAARERRVEPREVERARTEARRTARVAEAEARRRAEVAARAVRAAEQRREAAANALEEAEERLRRAQTELADAEEAHQRTKSELDEL